MRVAEEMEGVTWAATTVAMAATTAAMAATAVVMAASMAAAADVAAPVASVVVWKAVARLAVEAISASEMVAVAEAPD